jgi:hypothetical protein
MQTVRMTLTRRGLFRGLLAAAAAPLIAEATPEQIERYAWKRTLYPAWPRSRNQTLTVEALTREALAALERQLRYARELQPRESAGVEAIDFLGAQLLGAQAVLVFSDGDIAAAEAAGHALGATLNLRRPPTRFVSLDPVIDPSNLDSAVVTGRSGLQLRGMRAYDSMSDSVVLRFDTAYL